MPTYEYACTSCGEHTEIAQSFSDPPLAQCPRCDGPVRKVYGSVGIVLKGSGFYKTDSRASTNGAKSSKNGDRSEPSSSGKETTTGGGGDSGSSSGSGSSGAGSSGSGASASGSSAPANSSSGAAS